MVHPLFQITKHFNEVLDAREARQRSLLVAGVPDEDPDGRNICSTFQSIDAGPDEEIDAERWDGLS